MANFSRGWIVFATMIVAPTLFFLRGESGIAFAQSVPTSCSTSTSTSTGFSYGSQANFDGPSSTYFEGPPPCPTGSDSSAGSITDVANQRFNQMITNRVLGTVVLGINEQVNCDDCVSAFGSAGSFSAGIHGRKNLTSNLALLAGIAYTQYSEGGYRRSYLTSLGAVTVDGNTTAENYGVYGRAGWISRLSPRDEVAAAVEVWQLWQRVKGYSDQTLAFNPFDATFNTGTDQTTLVKVGGQWTHLFGSSIEANVNGGFVHAFGTQSGIVATVTGQGNVVPTIGDQSWFE